MKKPTLHLTNGLIVNTRLAEAGVEGTAVEWLDVLHEGPVPAGFGPAALRERRAEFLASCGWGSFDTIARNLASRDEALEQVSRFEEIVLWFEHDLFDQLQLIQILDRVPFDELALRDVDSVPPLTAVLTTTYLGTEPPSRFPDLFAARRPVSSAERVAARDAWEALRSYDPRAIADALPRVTALPSLAPALRRHLQQFPSFANGLSRTEQQTLEAVADGVRRVPDVYVRVNHEREEAIFMGDAPFLHHIRSLIEGTRPLLTAVPSELRYVSPLDGVSPQRPWHAGTLELTVDGVRVLAGEADRVELCGIDRWLGGVYLGGRGPVWRWDAARETMRFV